MSTKKKIKLKDYLDALVDEEGLKTEVTITLTHRTLIRTALYLTGTVIISSVAFFTIRGIVRNIEQIKAV